MKSSIGLIWNALPPERLSPRMSLDRCPVKEWNSGLASCCSSCWWSTASLGMGGCLSPEGFLDDRMTQGA